MAMRIKQKVTLPSLEKIIISIIILQRNHSADDEIQKYSLCQPTHPYYFHAVVRIEHLFSVAKLIFSGLTRNFIFEPNFTFTFI